MGMAKLIKLSCVYCKAPIFRSRGRVNEGKKFVWKTYCSLQCQIEYRQKREFLACAYCGKVIERISSKLSPHTYCSTSCAAKINNVKFPKRKAKVQICLYEKCQKEFKKRYNKMYCSLQCRRKAESERRQTPKELISAIIKLATALGRTPARRELGLTAYKCVTAFGSWNKAVTASGLQPNRSHDHRMYKRVLAKAHDGHICDSISEAIIDNWLHKNRVFHERHYPYPEGNYRADWAVLVEGKAVFIEYFGLANDSPRYDRSTKKKQALCRKHSIKLIEIYPRDLYPKIQTAGKLENKLMSLSVFTGVTA